MIFTVYFTDSQTIIQVYGSIFIYLTYNLLSSLMDQTKQETKRQLQYPFVRQITKMTRDISFEPKIISELTASDGYTSVIEKILIINQDDIRPAVIALKLGIQTEQVLKHPYTQEETTDYVIEYETIIHGEYIQAGETRILRLTDFPLEPNKFLMLQTEDSTQKVNCLVQQTIQVNS